VWSGGLEVLICSFAIQKQAQIDASGTTNNLGRQYYKLTAAE
jgi:hypothetical protein